MGAPCGPPWPTLTYPALAKPLYPPFSQVQRYREHIVSKHADVAGEGAAAPLTSGGARIVPEIPAWMRLPESSDP